jgi:predicted MFS family arabinose efflux permease
MQTPSEPSINRVGRFADFFGLRRNLIILLVAIFVIGAGEELWMRFVPKYLQVLGAGALVIGLYDALRTLLGALYAYPGGVLVDLWGHRRAFLYFNLISIAGYSIVLAVPHWGAVIAGMFLFLSWTFLSVPAAFSLVGATLEANRHSMGIGVQSVIRRMPAMISPILGGMLIDRFGVVPGVRVALLLSILLSAATLLVQRQLPPMEAPAPARWNFWQSVGSFDARIRRLLLSDILVRFCERIPYAWAIIFAMDYVGTSGQQVGVLVLIEVATASLCIIPASHFADKTQREPFVLVTFIMFTAFPIALMVSRNFNMLACAFAIRGLKEFGDTSRKALIIGYSDPQRRGQMVGTYYLIRDLIVSLGALLGAWLWKLGPRLNFLAAAAFGIAGTIFYLNTMRHQRQSELVNLKEEISRGRSL